MVPSDPAYRMLGVFLGSNIGLLDNWAGRRALEKIYNLRPEGEDESSEDEDEDE